MIDDALVLGVGGEEGLDREVVHGTGQAPGNLMDQHGGADLPADRPAESDVPSSGGLPVAGLPVWKGSDVTVPLGGGEAAAGCRAGLISTTSEKLGQAT